MADFHPLTALRFRDFRIDRLAQQLWHDAELIPLRPQSWEVLRYLVERSGTVVSTAELFEALWPQTTVTPSVLTNIIRELRAALDDRTEPARFIATVRRRGYRFIAPVEVSDAAMSGTAEPKAPVPLVGRATELEGLEHCWDQALRGRRQNVFVVGEPGIGKTTLLAGFLATRVATGASDQRIAQAACIDARGVHESYLPALALVESMATADRRVAALLRRYAPSWLAQMPALLSAEEHQRLQLSMVGSGAERMLREGAGFLEALANDRPLLLVIEDLHWADAATVDLIAFLARRTQPAKLLTVFTYRSADAIAHRHPIAEVAWQARQQGLATQIVVPPFTDVEVGALLELRLRGKSGSHLAHEIQRRSGGNALFVTALADQLLESGRLRQERGEWIIDHTGAGAALHMPDELRAAIEAQLRSLSAEARGLLEAAAVEGEEFSVSAAAESAALSVPDAEDLLHDVASQYQFVVAAAPRQWPNGETTRRYRFRHALFHRVLLDALPPSRERQLHRRTGECLERAYGDRAAELAAPLLVHFEACDDVPRRIRYHALLGRAAVSRSVFAEAVAHFEETKSQLRRLPDTRERALREAEIQLEMGNTLILARGSGDAAQAFAEAEALAQMAEAPRERFRALLGLTGSLFDGGDVAAFGAAVGKIVAMTPQVPSLEAQMWWRRGQLEFLRGNLVLARDALERSIASPGEADIPRVVDFRCVALMQLSLVLALLGRSNEARQVHDAGLRRSAKLEAPFNRCHVQWLASFNLLILGDRRGALAMARRCVEEIERHCFTAFRLRHVFVDMLSGSGAASIAALVRLVDEDIPSRGIIWRALLAEAHLDAHDADAALSCVRQARHDAELLGQGWYAPELYRLEGEALLRAPSTSARSDGGHQAEAGTCFRLAIELAREQRACFWHDRASRCAR